MEKLSFYGCSTAGLGKYRMGSYGQIGHYNLEVKDRAGWFRRETRCSLRGSLNVSYQK